jgi:hypothetical protein
MTSGKGTISMGGTTTFKEALISPMLKDLSSSVSCFKAEILHPDNPLLAEFQCWYNATGFISGKFADTDV